MIQSNVELNRYNTYKVGGEAEYFTKVNSVADLLKAKAWAIENNKRVNVIGKGSNLLIASGLIEGLTIVNNLKGYSIDEEGILTVYSGENISCLATKLSKEGWCGLEWAVGIPGSVGGAITMNAGAHKECVADKLIDITALSRKNNLVEFSNEELDFAYRHTNIQDSNYFVVEGRFQLTQEKSRGEAWAKAQEYISYRHTTQPYNLPSCGSVFRNPLNKQAGKLIEDSYLKGFSFLGAEVSKKHANFIINNGDATAESIFTLMNFVERIIKDKYDINLIREVKTLGSLREISLFGVDPDELNEIVKQGMKTNAK